MVSVPIRTLRRRLGVKTFPDVSSFRTLITDIKKSSGLEDANIHKRLQTIVGDSTVQTGIRCLALKALQPRLDDTRIEKLFIDCMQEASHPTALRLAAGRALKKLHERPDVSEAFVRLYERLEEPSSGMIRLMQEVALIPDLLRNLVRQVSPYTYSGEAERTAAKILAPYAFHDSVWKDFFWSVDARVPYRLRPPLTEGAVAVQRFMREFKNQQTLIDFLIGKLNDPEREKAANALEYCLSYTRDLTLSRIFHHVCDLKEDGIAYAAELIIDAQGSLSEADLKPYIQESTPRNRFLAAALCYTEELDPQLLKKLSGSQDPLTLLLSLRGSQRLGELSPSSSCFNGKPPSIACIRKLRENAERALEVEDDEIGEAAAEALTGIRKFERQLRRK